MEESFWQLLRAGLWQDPIWLKDFKKLSDDQWKFISKIAKMTGTTGVVIEGISLLPPDLMPSKQITTKFVMASMSYRNSHIKHNIAIKHLFEFFKEHEINAMLLKGQGVATSYEKPESRGCGDIDIYIGADQLDHALEELEKQGHTQIEEINDTGKHASLFFEDQTIELHRYSAHIDNPKYDVIYQRWWEEEKSKPCRLYATSIGEISNKPSEEAVKIDIPSPTINAFFLFYHIFHHFIGKDVQFRQFCDLARHLWVNRDIINSSELLNKIAEMRLLNVWKLFGTFLNKYLGLPTSVFPGYEEMPPKKLDLFVERLRDKCFYPKKAQKKRPEGKIMGKLFSFKEHIKAAAGVMKIFPREGWEYVLGTMRSGTILFFSSGNRSNTFEHYQERKKSQNNDH